MKSSQTLNIKSYVHEEEKIKPITGIYSKDFNLSGCLTERDFFIDDNNIKMQYNTFVGGQQYNIYEGTQKKDWQSIVREGIDFQKVEKIKSQNIKSWTPVYSRGAYSIYWNLINFYSSYHYSGILKNAFDDSNRMEIKLDENCSKSSIEVAIWTRDSNFVKYPYKIYKYQEIEREIIFSGPFAVKTTSGWNFPLFKSIEAILEKDSVSEDSRNRYSSIVLNGETFYYAPGELLKNQSNNKRNLPVYGIEAEEKHVRVPNYQIVEDTVIANSRDNIKIGVEEKDSLSISKYWEEKGKGNSNGRLVFTKYFPIKKGSFSLVGMNSSNDIKEFEEVESISNHDNSKYIYSVDYDLGVIQIGGVTEPDLILKEDLSSTDTEILILNIEEMKSYPKSGILKIGDELIFYNEKDYNRFFQCTRGYQGTQINSYVRGEVFRSIQNGKSLDASNKVYCKYEAVPKIRYEVSEMQNRFANKYGFLNLKPIHNVRDNGIIQISSIDKHVSDIQLEIDADLISGNIYGPLFYGTDFRQFTARAIDSLGNPVEDIEITIKFSNGPGYLGYSLREYTGISNSEGEIYTLYGVPYDWDSISKRIIDVTRNNLSTEMTAERLPESVSPEEIQIYQIMKHDPILGTNGKKMTPWISYGGDPNWGDAHPNYGKAWVKVLAAKDDFVSNYEGGEISIFLQGPNQEKLRFDKKIIQSVEMKDELNINGVVNPNRGNTIGVHFIMDTNIPAQYSSWNLDEVIVFEREAVKFSPINLNGSRRVVYEWKSDAVHPITKVNGAYFPLRADRVIGNKLFFDEKLLPIPDPYGNDSNVGGYLAVCSDIAEFYAECVDPTSGNIIKSNRIKVRIDIPPYLNGVSSTNGLSIPYGFKIAEEGFVDASGIGGATFLTINPFDSNTLDLMLEII